MTGSLRIGGILLAAGGSKRLGEPKQLVEVLGKTLLRRAAEAINDSVCDPIVVVLGAEAAKASAEITDLRMKTCVNTDWESGMSSSITAGLQELLSIEPDVEAVVITLCDQPYVASETIDRLVRKFEDTGKLMIAARYEGVVGVPALFSKKVFGSFAGLEGDKGARDLLREPNASVETIDFEPAAFDVDTRDDL